MDIIELVKTASLAKIQQLHRDGHLGKDPQTDFMALRTALTFNKSDIVDFLVSSNCGLQSTSELKMPDASLDNHLHHAARAGDWTTMQRLMLAQVRMTADAAGNTALHLAFLHERDFVVDQILELMANKKRFANVKNKLGLSYLHVACTRGNKEAIEGFLMTAPVAGTISADSFMWAGNNALHFAAMHGSAPALRALTSLPNWRTTLDVENAAGMIPSQMIRAQVAEKLALDDIMSGTQPNTSGVNERLHSGDTALHNAIRSGSLENVKALVDRGADTSTKDKEDMTPLHLAMYSGDEGIVDVLYEATDVENQDAMIDKNGLNYLHVACSRNDLETAKWLLSNSKKQLDAQVLYDRRLQLYSCYTPLHFAVRYGHSRMVEWLMENKADVNLGADGVDGTPLHLAFALGHVEIVELLLKSGADPKVVRAVDGRTTLHLLVKIENTEPMLPYIEKLIELGVDVDAQDLDGNTALHLAAARGNKGCPCVELLLEHGADVNVLNGKYETPFNMFTKADLAMKIARPEDYIIFYNHVQRLKVLGLMVDSRNDECYKLVTSENNPSYDPKHAKQLKLAIQQTCNEKLELQKVVLDRGDSAFSMYDFIKCRLSLAAEFVECADLVELAEKDEYGKRFPNFGFLVKLRYKEALRFNRGELDGSGAKDDGVGGKRRRFSRS